VLSVHIVLQGGTGTIYPLAIRALREGVSFYEKP
jgi:hypothetical protein